MLIHGAAESGLAWRPWVPTFSRQYRVIIPDLPGCGDSPPDPLVAQWSMEALADLLRNFTDGLKIASVHLVGAKFGGTLALAAVARHPGLAQTLTVLDVHVNAHSTAGTANTRDTIRRDGLRQWADGTMRARLGSGASPQKLAWWTDYMASSDTDATLALMAAADGLALEPVMGKIKAPTLLLTTRGSAVTSVGALERWASLIPGASVGVIDGDAYHMAAAYPDRVAARVRAFIEKFS